jgi:hypothetical protein
MGIGDVSTSMGDVSRPWGMEVGVEAGSAATVL